MPFFLLEPLPPKMSVHGPGSRTFLSVTVQPKIVGVKLLKHAHAMGQVEAAPGEI